MANQIGRFFAHRPEEQAVADIAAHLRRFWEPRMRRAAIAHLEEGGAGLEERPRKAIDLLARTDVG
jgi:formate dehydrogenase subunit delta